MPWSPFPDARDRTLAKEGWTVMRELQTSIVCDAVRSRMRLPRRLVRWKSRSCFETLLTELLSTNGGCVVRNHSPLGLRRRNSAVSKALLAFFNGLSGRGPARHDVVQPPLRRLRQQRVDVAVVTPQANLSTVDLLNRNEGERDDV